jgi:FdhD protein
MTASFAGGAPVRAVPVVRVGGAQPGRAHDLAAVEEPLQILVAGRPFAVIMRTPGADRALVAGFLVAEGIVREPGDLLGVDEAPDAAGRAQHNVVDVHLGPAASARLAQAARAVAMSSSCGLCGRRTIDALVADRPPVDSDVRMAADVVVELPRLMRGAQAAFDRTGGLHAAALVSPEGSLDRLAEDIGRHNAVDKVVGAMWLEGCWPVAGHALAVSGRASYEIVLKAFAAGVPIVAAVSAPSSLAIDLAERTGITLVGFVRDGRFNLYTHPARVVGTGAGHVSEAVSGAGAPSAAGAGSPSGGGRP